MTILTVEILRSEATAFSAAESRHPEPLLYGVTDGKAVGTYLEQKFRLYLKERYEFVEGNSASGIDFPGLFVDIKVTSVKQPQSSCPFKSARQKIFGLGYSLLIFVYDRNLPIDDIEASNIADEILRNPPIQGFLTISNALQWRLQYGRVIERASQEEGIIAVYRANL
jgi:hypothetical protein